MRAIKLTYLDENVKQHLQYIVFGESFIDQRATSHGIRFKFTGKERDSETGFDYFGARYYASGLSIWLSVDPLADKYPSMSAYMYCAGNPVMLVDIQGEFPIPFTVTMDDGTKIRVTINTGDGQSFRFKTYGRYAMRHNFRSTKGNRKSLALLRSNRSSELSQRSEDASDIAKMDAEYAGYKVTDILLKLAQQHNSIDLLVIGNHAVPHINYPMSLRIAHSIQNGDIDNSLYYMGNILYQYNGQSVTDANRTLAMDSEWSKERAQFVTDQYFGGSLVVQSSSRYGMPSNAISGLNLKPFGTDPVGISIGIKFKFLNRRQEKPEKHGTVLYL